MERGRAKADRRLRARRGSEAPVRRSGWRLDLKSYTSDAGEDDSNKMTRNDECVGVEWKGGGGEHKFENAQDPHKQGPRLQACACWHFAPFGCGSRRQRATLRQQVGIGQQAV